MVEEAFLYTLWYYVSHNFYILFVFLIIYSNEHATVGMGSLLLIQKRFLFLTRPQQYNGSSHFTGNEQALVPHSNTILDLDEGG